MRYLEKTVTVVTDVTFTSVCTIEGASRISIVVPTFEVGLSTDSANVWCQVANTTTASEFRRIKEDGVYSSASGYYDWEMLRGIGAYTVEAPEGVKAFKYMRLEVGSGSTSYTATAGVDFKVAMVIEH